MSDEDQLPEDDGSLKFWCFTNDNLPNYVKVAEVPLRRDEAIQRLREQRPTELAGATHAELAELDMFDVAPMPITRHGRVRVQFTPGEEINRMLAPMHGITVKVPTR